ncbi:DNA polymerase III subunit alpha [Kribbella qitaiheensis]|uniref:Error-prone DNA polymerase n=1 Tax=Kribbella qitaiheensis TaxID=1544730 RepID=A0A7G6X806_9ACTN|nr:error-prone DNA polymerase [Kribbella qitaiheensis]QNE22371.1 DNA polymerase III subunit alpha [Kribbella qitaiheensis]
MGWDNPPIPWSELERKLSGRSRPPAPADELFEADGGDGPAWSRHRPPYDPDPVDKPRRPDGPVVPYAELHCHSYYSFLDGASSPEHLVEESVRLGLHALALTDHDGFYGVVRMAEAAEEYDDLQTVFGAELSLELTKPQNGMADPEGSHLLVLAEQQQGYHRLAGAITEAQLRGQEKGRPVYDLEELAAIGEDSWLILTGCRKGLVRRALELGGQAEGPAAAARELDRLTALFGKDRVVVELIDHGLPLDTTRNAVLARLAAAEGLPVVATNNVHYSQPRRHKLAAAVAAVRARRSLDAMDGWLPPAGTAHLRSGEEMLARFRRYDGAVARSVELADQLAFSLRAAKPSLPHQEVPQGYDSMRWLKKLCRDGVKKRYADKPAELKAEAEARVERELQVISDLKFPGYFLIVRDIVMFAKRQGILYQGRGSAANSVVCYALEITAIDPVFYNLPFERFLSSARDEEPDIDVDFDSDRREEVIQYVYGKYGRRNAAQVANVITYRPKLAVRDMAKALGFSTGQQDAWSKQVDAWGAVRSSADHDIPPSVVALAEDLLKFPRHLGIHSGGMVLTDIPVGHVVPVEHARMENRTVLQWDKDDCAWMGLVKFDLLGLGMLAALQYAMDLVRKFLGEDWNLDTIPKEERGVYDQLCKADSVGVFQVESRAQMSTLPRLRPRSFYDLAIEVALIRPGPIQGGAVHPFIRRKMGEEPITYLHPALEPVLERTLGVPLFQEQLMQIAMTVGGCTGEDADLLRRAMGSKRGVEKISSLKAKLYDGMAASGITGETADQIYEKIEAFANFGFAESHSISFALLVYASTWLRLHYPAAFLAALLRAQPMGFYSPQSLVADARRHGVTVHRPDLHLSQTHATLEPLTPPPAPPLPTSGSPLTPTPSSPTLGSPVSTAPSSPTLGSPLTPTPSSPTSGSPVSTTAPSTTPDSPPTSAPSSPPASALVVATGNDSCLEKMQPAVGEFDPKVPFDSDLHRRDGQLTVRLGLAGVKSIGVTVATTIVEEREKNGPYTDMAELVRRTGLTAVQVEALATAGAFDSFGLSRRQALWNAGRAAEERPGHLSGVSNSGPPPMLPGMTEMETTMADLWATGISPDDHPIRHVRPSLDARGVLPANQLSTAEDGTRVYVGGVVTHRQRPATAAGVTFLNLEDETGMINIVCSNGVWNRYRRIARESSAMIIRGRLERSTGVTNLVADKLERLPLAAKTTSRDFR